MERPAAKQNNPATVRFGLFEADLHTRELRKSGIKIKLHDQPFQVLAFLLERPGEIVTREELQTRLWPSDTFVDFDLSLNSAVKKLRQALGDESDNPRFVETLYRRGYRFIAPVLVDGDANGRGLETSDAPGPQLLYKAPQLEADDSWPRKSRLRTAAICAGMLLVGIVGWMLLPVPSPRVLGFTQITSGGKLHELSGMVTDGQRIYFQAADRDRIALAEVSVSGGDSKLISTPFTSIFLGDIAPDCSGVMIVNFEDTNPTKKDPIWLLPLPAGSPRPLGVSGMPAVWSPDGRRLLMARGYDLYETNTDGSDAKKLATVPHRIGDIRVSPNGRKISLTLQNLNTNSSELWELNRDGTEAHPLLPGWNDPPKECCGRWTPDGKYLLFTSLHDGRNSLWALAERPWWFPGKMKPVQLTNGPLDFWTPIPSPDGKKIYAMGGLPRSEVLRYDGKAFVPYLSGVSASDLAFSADAKRVAYVSIPDQILWSSKIDGSDRIQLSPSGAGGMETGLPRWSPDGTQIVFMARLPNTDWRAYLVRSNGEGLRELIPGATAGFDPSWSPDGKSIVVAVNDLGPTSNMISIVDLKTGKVSLIPGGEKFFGPRWSPDGRYIAATTLDSQSMMLFDVASQKWTELAKIGVGYPSWSHDGQYLYFDAIFREDPALFRIRIADHKLERLGDLRDVHRFWGMFAEWSGLTPDDAPLVTRDISSPEIYALDWQP